MNSLKSKIFSGFLSATLVSTSFYHVPAAFSITCNNDARSFQCLDQDGGDLWEQGGSHTPKHVNNDEHETSSSQAGNAEDIEAYQRWYREHHHGEFGFAQGKNGDQQSFGFDVANDGSYCLSRDGQAGTFEKAPKTGRAIPDMKQMHPERPGSSTASPKRVRTDYHRDAHPFAGADPGTSAPDFG